jgi:hypothetical protein
VSVRQHQKNVQHGKVTDYEAAMTFLYCEMRMQKILLLVISVTEYVLIRELSHDTSFVTISVRHNFAPELIYRKYS